MKKTIADGWHKWGIYDLYVEDGRVLRGTTKGWDAKTVYAYKWTPSINAWVKGQPKLGTLKRSAAWEMK